MNDSSTHDGPAPVDLPPEERLRADTYLLLSQLWWAPPDATMLAALAGAADAQDPEDAASRMSAPWQRLKAACAATTPERVTAEFRALFEGTGKPEILLHASWHLVGSMNDKPLAELRADLRELGLDPESPDVPEDHLAIVLDAMRWLILQPPQLPAGAAPEAALELGLREQQRFFRRHLFSWLPDGLLPMVARHPLADFYAALAGFTEAFVEVEAQAFEMLDAQDEAERERQARQGGAAVVRPPQPRSGQPGAGNGEDDAGAA